MQFSMYVLILEDDKQKWKKIKKKSEKYLWGWREQFIGLSERIFGKVEVR